MASVVSLGGPGPPRRCALTWRCGVVAHHHAVVIQAPLGTPVDVVVHVAAGEGTVASTGHLLTRLVEPIHPYRAGEEVDIAVLVDVLGLLGREDAKLRRHRGVWRSAAAGRRAVGTEGAVVVGLGVLHLDLQRTIRIQPLTLSDLRPVNHLLPQGGTTLVGANAPQGEHRPGHLETEGAGELLVLDRLGALQIAATRHHRPRRRRMVSQRRQARQRQHGHNQAQHHPPAQPPATPPTCGLHVLTFPPPHGPTTSTPSPTFFRSPSHRIVLPSA